MNATTVVMTMSPHAANQSSRVSPPAIRFDPASTATAPAAAGVAVLLGVLLGARVGVWFAVADGVKVAVGVLLGVNVRVAHSPPPAMAGVLVARKPG